MNQLKSYQANEKTRFIQLKAAVNQLKAYQNNQNTTAWANAKQEELEVELEREGNTKKKYVFAISS
jgi:hypothetical protein